MAFITKHTVTAVTDAAGDATVEIPPVSGRILAVVYTKAPSNSYAVGVVFDVKTKESGQIVWSETAVGASKTTHPKVLNQNSGGANLTAEYDHVYAADEPLQIVIANGGNSKTGTFQILVG